MVFSATFNNISVISWYSVLLGVETGVPWERHQFAANHWQTNLLDLLFEINASYVGSLSSSRKLKDKIKGQGSVPSLLVFFISLITEWFLLLFYILFISYFNQPNNQKIRLVTKHNKNFPPAPQFNGNSVFLLYMRTYMSIMTFTD